MSWNGADLFVHGGTLASLPAALAAGTGATGSFEEFPVAVTVRDGWLHVHFSADGVDELPDDIGAVTTSGRVVAVRYVGVADTWTLEVAEDGVLVRTLALSAGVTVVDEGDALPEEDGDRDDPEEWTFTTLEHLTGTLVPALPTREEAWTRLVPT